MYSRQEASRLRQEFWTVFGQYMTPVLSVEGERPNWMNYKTGEKDLFFRMDADNKKAVIAIEIRQKDPGVRHLYFEQMLQLRPVLHDALGEEWTWVANDTDDSGRSFSRVYTERRGLSIYRKEDWPALIQFFKPRIIALDAFWNTARYAFDMLR